MRTLSPTLFWYIFKDLLKVFLLANGALAGILSFGGLLRPLTEQGLEAWQVGLLLAYFTPAMTAYSLPIAALFATTVVYGRLSADNEILACRAGGLSHLSLALPASILGLIVALISALLLLFIVPIYTLKVERVVYSNLAKIIANDIERKHQIRLPGMNLSVFARSARVPPGQRPDDFEQQVELVNPTIVTFEYPYAGDPDRAKSKLQVPKDFHTAKSAIVKLTHRPGDEQLQLTVELKNGLKFPRKLSAGQLGGVGATEAGPFDLPSPISEDTRFLDIRELRRLHADRTQSPRIKSVLTDFTRHDQQFAFLHALRDELNVERLPRRVSYVAFGGSETVRLEHHGELARTPAVEKGGDVVLTSGRDPADLEPRIEMVVERRGQTVRYKARDATVSARPVSDANRMDVAIELRQVMREDTATPRGAFRYNFSVTMTPEIRAIADRTFTDYNVNPDLPRDQLIKTITQEQQRKLLRQLTVLTNDIISESNSRISFAISCLILTFVGCALGMMFRSGNFLSAFAISFIPALVSITLIVAGQRVAGSIPLGYPKSENPIQLGLALIWSGNAINFVLAVVLWWRLQRQ